LLKPLRSIHAGSRRFTLHTSVPNSAKAVALFGDRIPESAFRVEVDREPLCEDERLDVLLELAEHIGIERLFGL
jgi:hypothetical protein